MICFPSIPAVRFSISSNNFPIDFPVLSDAPFEADAEQFLRFDRKFHRQLAKNFFAIAVHNHVHGVLCGNAALVANKKSGLRQSFEVDASCSTCTNYYYYLDVRKRVGAAVDAQQKESHWE